MTEYPRTSICRSEVSTCSQERFCLGSVTGMHHRYRKCVYEHVYVFASVTKLSDTN